VTVIDISSREGITRPHQLQHVGTVIGQHHARKWPRTDAAELEYPQPFQRATSGR
jgi:hypothetical protein